MKFSTTIALSFIGCVAIIEESTAKRQLLRGLSSEDDDEESPRQMGTTTTFRMCPDSFPGDGTRCHITGVTCYYDDNLLIAGDHASCKCTYSTAESEALWFCQGNNNENEKIQMEDDENDEDEIETESITDTNSLTSTNQTSSTNNINDFLRAEINKLTNKTNNDDEDEETFNTIETEAPSLPIDELTSLCPTFYPGDRSKCSNIGISCDYNVLFDYDKATCECTHEGVWFCEGNREKQDVKNDEGIIEIETDESLSTSSDNNENVEVEIVENNEKDSEDDDQDKEEGDYKMQKPISKDGPNVAAIASVIAVPVAVALMIILCYFSIRISTLKESSNSLKDETFSDPLQNEAMEGSLSIADVPLSSSSTPTPPPLALFKNDESSYDDDRMTDVEIV